MIRLPAALLALAAALTLAGPAAGQSKVRIANTPGADTSAAFVAIEQGYFRSHGLEVEFVTGANGSTFPAALMSHSVEVAAVTTPVLLQADAGGLDLVAIAAGSYTAKGAKTTAVMTRKDSPIHAPADFVGKKVGVISVNGMLAILFDDWLARQGVDPSRVVLVEAAIPQIANLLASGMLDAIVVPEPIITRAMHTFGAVPIYFTDDFPNLPLIIYVTTREWADTNGGLIDALIAGLREGVAFTKTDPGETRRIVAKYLNFPPDLVQQMAMPPVGVDLTAAELRRVADILRAQNQLAGSTDAARLIRPIPPPH
jgi:NitT/TauT family transport system substrate-binding protein